MVAPEPYFQRFPHDQMVLPPVPEGDLDDIPPLGISSSNSAKNGLSRYPDNQQRMWAGYYASVAFMDHQLGRMLDELEALGLADSTAIVFTSDHGYHLGDHTFWQKANLHEQVIRVPLLIAVPGLSAGRSTSLVELTDLMPTLCELVGLPVPEGVEGKSLLPLLRDDPTLKLRDATLSFSNNHHALRSERWAYMRYADGSEELYDMEADPGQHRNLVPLEVETEALTQMRLSLQKRLSETAPARRNPRKKEAPRP
jgi:iduronate 2-sulfatase